MEGTELEGREDGSFLAKGANPGTDTYVVTIDSGFDQLTGVRLEVLPHPSLPGNGPGRAGNGNFVLSEITARLETAGAEPELYVRLSACHCPSTGEVPMRDLSSTPPAKNSIWKGSPALP